MNVAGFGFRQSATLDSLRSALAACAVSHDVPALAALATPQDKAETELFKRFAAELALPVIALAPDALQAMETPTQSATVQTLRGTGSVAEASALAAIGINAKLTHKRVVSQDRRATCAIAQGDSL
ncbi:cobalamin biosynthesis protein [Shimia sp. R11_0]|uniref:cobalamin biosynthesis protein n=1 Tax=Shimia sp. R11_0 TaxID=2821096 RepID=UPI001ADAB929|nr:cobalamin biosynthesis protein [Shimia sp. R11_0]MBO9479014.1 cobalamin biosynthesis protein [Shimia sp. R11_0]